MLKRNLLAIYTSPPFSPCRCLRGTASSGHKLCVRTRFKGTVASGPSSVAAAAAAALVAAALAAALVVALALAALRNALMRKLE